MRHTLLLSLVTFLSFRSHSQVSLDPVALISADKTQTGLCYNNSESMKGKVTNDRYATHFNSDTVFLDVFQTGVWTKKTAHVGNNISLACTAYQRDTIWICWAEPNRIKAKYTSNKGVTWSSTYSVSPAQSVGGPSMFASDNGKIHITWFATTATDTTIKHNVFSGGNFLVSPNTISTPGFKAIWPSITAKGDSVFCTWKEYHTNKYKIYYSRSFSGGSAGSWLATPLQTSTLTAGGKDPSISYSYNSSLSQHILYIAFDASNKIWYQQSTDLGLTWTFPIVISDSLKLSQFARITSNNNGFVGVAYEHRRSNNLFDDKKKDVGFVYSSNWGSSFTSNDSTAYLNSPFGSILGLINKINENTFYLTWLTHDTVQSNYKYYERNINLGTVGLNTYKYEIKELTTYPNPVNDYLFIRSTHQITEIIIFDVFGKIIKQTTENLDNGKISLIGLNDGIYFIKFVDPIGNSKTEKIMLTN